MLASPNVMMADARRHGYAIPAFNYYNTALLVNCGVVVGGTPFNGGYGGVVQSLIGIFLLGVLENAMSLLNISSYYQQLVRGIVIVFVIAMDCNAR